MAKKIKVEKNKKAQDEDKFLPTEAIIEQIGKEGSSLMMITDLEKARKKKKSSAIRFVGEQANFLHDELVEKVEALSEKFSVNVKLKTQIILTLKE
jgi:hypothetical protein